MRGGWQAALPRGPWGQAEEQARPEHRGCCAPCRMILSLLLRCLACSCCGLGAPARGWGSRLAMPPGYPPCSSSWGGVVAVSRAGPAADVCASPVLMPVASSPPVLVHVHTWMRGDTHSSTHGCHIFTVSLWTHEHPQSPRISMDTHTCARTFPYAGPRGIGGCTQPVTHTQVSSLSRTPPPPSIGLPLPPLSLQ